jgi:hypothetical protein
MTSEEDTFENKDDFDNFSKKNGSLRIRSKDFNGDI